MTTLSLPDPRIGRGEVVEYLRWLADQPEGVVHRTWLFHAAHLIRRDANVVWVHGQRHGEEAV